MDRIFCFETYKYKEEGKFGICYETISFFLHLHIFVARQKHIEINNQTSLQISFMNNKKIPSHVLSFLGMSILTKMYV